jgi:preprotein translocase subunit YajC
VNILLVQLACIAILWFLCWREKRKDEEIRTVWLNSINRKYKKRVEKLENE